MKPSQGRIVLVPFNGGKYWPAIIVDVYQDGATIDCIAFQVKGAFPVVNLPAGVNQVEGVPGNDAGWIWPPRV